MRDDSAPTAPTGCARATWPWRPVADLPAAWHELAVPEVHRLAAAWQERTGRIEPAKARRRLVARLRCARAVDALLEEFIPHLDVLVAVPPGHGTPVAAAGGGSQRPHDLAELAAHAEVVADGLYDLLNRQHTLTVPFLRQLHRLLTRADAVSGAPLPAGWKVETNRVLGGDGHTVPEYCPPEHVAAEVDRLIAMQAMHRTMDVPPEVEAAWLYHRFEQIHPFKDGNGRVGRALASWVLVQAGWFPFVVPRTIHYPHVEALNACFATGDLRPLVGLIARDQIAAFQEALDLLPEIAGNATAEKDAPRHRGGAGPDARPRTGAANGPATARRRSRRGHNR